MNPEFETIDMLKREWDALQPLVAADEQRLWKKLRLEWNYHSNHIEGNTLTYGETELLLLHGQTHGNHTLREYEEMKAHDVGINHLRNLAADRNRLITPSDIRDLNKIILKEPFWKPARTPDGQPSRIQVIPGEYKTVPNNVITATGELFEYALPIEVPARMQELIDGADEDFSKREVHLLEVAAKLHHSFVLIHPFDDGNGRVARMLVNYLLLRDGYPPIIVPTEKKSEYLASLRLADVGEIGALVKFVSEQLEWSLKMAIHAGKGEDIGEPGDVDKQVALFIREQKVLTERRTDEKEAIQLVVDISLRPFVERLEEKLKKLDPLFSTLDILAIDGFGNLSAQDRFSAHSELKTAGPGKKLSVTFAFCGYKGVAEQSFDFQTVIQFHFPAGLYTITHDGDIIVAKSYSEPILAEEIDKLTARILSKSFETIRGKAGS